jgi:hypothetical protein
MVFCALAIFWRWRSVASASAARSLVDFSELMRCCSGVGGLLMTSCTCIQIFMPNNTMEKCRSYLASINNYMQTYKNITDRRKTDAWLKSNGISVNQIYVGSAQLFLAQKLATTTLKDHVQLLQQNQAAVLNNFLRAANGQQRIKITQAQCFKVLNITKQAQRKYAQSIKRKVFGHRVDQ